MAPETLAPCPTCSTLRDEEHAYQKFGWEASNTHLPAAAAQLVLALDLRPYGSRKLQLLQCASCGCYYLYATDYEYLVNGSEDAETLTRLTAAQAAGYLRGDT